MRAIEIERRFVYHSPQYPGFTSWCGLWAMPGTELMCCFTQATGPLAGRPAAPPEVRHRLEWPPVVGEGEGAMAAEAYDMTGLELANVHLRSRDGGDTWQWAASDCFRSCMNGITGEGAVALSDGTLLRGVWGPYLPYDPVPYDGYLQRSTDGGISWGPAELICGQPGWLFWPKRLRVLRDGRVLAGGGLFRIQGANDTRGDWSRDSKPALFVSDPDGRDWSGPIAIVPPHQDHQALGLTEEFDWAELDSGELLVVLRADRAPGGPCRLQTRLVAAGDAWRPTDVEPAPFPHSGHPELVTAPGGQVLHVATTGLSWTSDGGRTWQPLALDDGLQTLRPRPATGYYPRSVALADGRVLVIGHVGGDDGYGVTDQSIVSLRFRLAW